MKYFLLCLVFISCQKEICETCPPDSSKTFLDYDIDLWNQQEIGHIEIQVNGEFVHLFAGDFDEQQGVYKPDEPIEITDRLVNVKGGESYEVTYIMVANGGGTITYYETFVKE